MEQNPKIRIIHHSGQQRTIRLQLFNSWKLDSNGVTRYGWKTVDESTNEDIIKNFTADINAIAQTAAPIVEKKKDAVSAEAEDVNEVEMPDAKIAEEIELQDSDEPGETLSYEEAEKFTKSDVAKAIANGEPMQYGNPEKTSKDFFDTLQKIEKEAEKKEAPKRKRPPVKRKKK